jgi:hypothetical protein
MSYVMPGRHGLVWYSSRPMPILWSVPLDWQELFSCEFWQFHLLAQCILLV